MDELWLPIPGFDGYESSDRGNVRSLDRVVTFKDGRRRRFTGQLLKPCAWGVKTGRKPYRTVILYSDGGEKTCKVAHLVLLAHVGPKPFTGADARHLNDDSLNDSASNLAWGTRLENSQDKRRNGTMPMGANHSRAQLTDDDVLAIRASAANGTKQWVLAERHGVHQSTISRLIAGKAWSHLTKENGQCRVTQN